MSVNSETIREGNMMKFPYETLGEVEKECQIEIDPRNTELSAETVPIILLNLLQKIENIEQAGSEMRKENDELKQTIENNKHLNQNTEEETNKLKIDIIKLKTIQEELEKENNNIKCSLDFAYIKISKLEENDKIHFENERKMDQNMKTIQNDNNKIKTDNTKMKEKNVKSEAYSRRSNLRFEGIPTAQNESNVQCRNKVYDFLRTELGMQDAERNIVIERCHRDSKYPNQSPPSIIARFLSFRDREEIWAKRNKVNQNNKNKFYLNEDFPQEVEKRRSFLRPYVKAAYDNNMKATLLGDVLLVEGDRYTIDELDKLPEKIRPEKTVVKTNGKTTVFFRRDAFMSNFYPSPMNIDNVEYSCVEQYYMAEKAKKFDDQETKEKIMNSKNPNEINFFGKSVKGFNQNAWNDVAIEAMKTGVKEKFAQNPKLAEFLEKTGETQIGEGSEKDLTWGTGISVFHKDALNTDKWRGKNLLGKILMEVRTKLRKV